MWYNSVSQDCPDKPVPVDSLTLRNLYSQTAPSVNMCEWGRQCTSVGYLGIVNSVIRLQGWETRKDN